MSDQHLRHLAVIAGTAPELPTDVDHAVATSCAKAAQVARDAFALAPGLQAFSWLCPDLDHILSRASPPVAARACAAGARLLAGAAADLGASLRLCGRPDELQGAAFDPPSHPAADRTLLWFLRYSGRDEIVRAAERFCRAHPGRQLDDGELDAWLDTAGVPDPDLLLYAGGPLEPRDVLLWQGSYAEIWHTPEPWPALATADLQRALADFAERQRRFGR